MRTGNFFCCHNFLCVSFICWAHFFPYIIFFYLNISLSLFLSLQVSILAVSCWLVTAVVVDCVNCIWFIAAFDWLLECEECCGFVRKSRCSLSPCCCCCRILQRLCSRECARCTWIYIVSLRVFVCSTLNVVFFLLSDKKFLWIVGTTREIKNASNAQLRPNGAMNWGWRDEIPSDACDMCVFSAICDPISGQMINCVTQMNDSSFVESNGCSGTLQGHARNHLDGTRPSI